MAGLTSTGFLALTRAEALANIEAYLRAKISDRLDLSEDQVLGSLNAIVADHLEQLWQVAEEAYLAFDLTNATDDRVVALGVLMGCPRRGATKGLVRATVQLGAGLTFAPGELVAAVTDEPTNTWQNRSTITTVSSGFYSAVFESQTAGASAIAAAGTLEVIPTPIAGWTSITNAADAEPGLDLEPIDALRIRIAASVGRGGQHTTSAIRAAVVNVAGVLSCQVFENVLSVTANGLPPHSLRVVVWDGATQAASNNELAQAIWDHSATYSVGVQTGTAFDDELGAQLVNFDRATAVACTVAVQIQSASRVARADVRAAILAKWPGGSGTGLVGAEVTFHRVSGSVFAVPGVDDWVTFTVNGGTADLPASATTVYQLTEGNITVTGDVT